jgi:hypothetical protein
MGKGGKILQNANHEIELLQQNLDHALQKIDRLVEFNNSLMGKFIELKVCNNKVYQEFVGFTTQHINELEERLESLDQRVIDILALHDKKDQMIESLKQELLAKENVLLTLESEVKKEKVMCDAICETSDLLQIVLMILVNWLMLMTYMCLSHAMRLKMMILVIFYEGEPHIEDDEIGCFERHTKGIGSKLMKKWVLMEKF